MAAPGESIELRETHRADVERLLAQAVEEEVRRSGGAVDGGPGRGPDLRGADWARLMREPHPARDHTLTDSAEAYALMLERGVEPESGWQAWELGMVPSRQSRDVIAA